MAGNPSPERKPNYRAYIEADLVLVNRDLEWLDTQLGVINNKFDSGTREERNKLIKQHDIYLQRKQELLIELARLEVELRKCLPKNG